MACRLDGDKIPTIDYDMMFDMTKHGDTRFISVILYTPPQRRWAFAVVWKDQLYECHGPQTKELIWPQWI